MKILMIEDNPGDVELFRFALKQAQLDCELAVISDGGEALALIQGEHPTPTQETPDLVLLDLNLPKVGGREILTAMRSGTTFGSVPVVIFTSSSSRREREELEPLQVARHITKPSDLDEFLRIGTVVREVLEEYTNLRLGDAGA